MKPALTLWTIVLTALFVVGGVTRSSTQAQGAASVVIQTKEPGNDLVYADFGTMKYDRPASNRGGFIQIFSFQENQQMPAKVKGREGANPPAPELVRVTKDDPNVAASFDYALLAPNQYAGVGMIIIGMTDHDDKAVADDVTGYSYLTLQASATGVSSLTVEFLSQGQGINISVGSPQANIQLTPGFNVYKIPLSQLAQPAWAPVKVSTKDVLKKLTAINFIVGCAPCTTTKGRVVLDNIVLHR